VCEAGQGAVKGQLCCWCESW